MKSLLSIACFGVLALSGCKQGEGQRCQVLSDCDSPLVCNKATHTCETSDNNNAAIDAMVPVFIDGGVDAGSDAAPDGATPPDAPPPDALPPD